MVVRLSLLISVLFFFSTFAEAATVRFVPTVKVNYNCTTGHPRKCETDDLVFATVIAEVKNGYGSWNFTQDYGDASYWLSVAIYEDDPGIFDVFVQGNVIDKTDTSRLIWSYFRTELKTGETFATISGFTMPLLVEDRQYEMGFNITNFSVEP
jgi:hypothetical protein